MPCLAPARAGSMPVRRRNRESLPGRRGIKPCL